MKKTIAGTEVDVNEEGYLTDMSQWNEAIAAAIAAEEGIPTLTDAHHKVLQYLRKQQAAGAALTLRALPRRTTEEVLKDRRHPEAGGLHLNPEPVFHHESH